MPQVFTEDQLKAGADQGDLDVNLQFGDGVAPADPTAAITQALGNLTVEVAQVRAAIEAQPKGNPEKLALELSRLTGVIATNLAAILELLKRPGQPATKEWTFTWVDSAGNQRTMKAKRN